VGFMFWAAVLCDLNYIELCWGMYFGGSHIVGAAMCDQ
jgi:hypothetical protein